MMKKITIEETFQANKREGNLCNGYILKIERSDKAVENSSTYICIDLQELLNMIEELFK